MSSGTRQEVLGNLRRPCISAGLQYRKKHIDLEVSERQFPEIHRIASGFARQIGHEMGHHYAGHLDFWRNMTVQLGSWFVWVRLWYSRRCEFTCDQYGLACAENLQESLRAMCNLSVGTHLASQVDIEEAIAQKAAHELGVS